MQPRKTIEARPVENGAGDRLVADAHAGDPVALQALLHQYGTRLLAYIHEQFPRQLGPVLSPEDVFQGTCLEAFRRIHDFVPEHEESMLSWLMTMARHNIVDFLRAKNALKRGGVRCKQARDELSINATFLDTIAVDRRMPVISLTARELILALENSMKRLPIDQQQAIRMRHIDGLAAKDAAAKMNRTEGAFHQLCHRGLKKMREELRSISIYL